MPCTNAALRVPITCSRSALEARKHPLPSAAGIWSGGSAIAGSSATPDARYRKNRGLPGRRLASSLRIRSSMCGRVGRELAAGRLSGGAISLIWGREVGVPVHELPVAVNAPVDMGDPDHHVARRPAVDADLAALETDCVGEVSAG